MRGGWEIPAVDQELRTDYNLTRIRRRIVVYSCRHTGSLSKKAARRQRDFGANRCQNNFRKKLYFIKIERCWSQSPVVAIALLVRCFTEWY